MTLLHMTIAVEWEVKHQINQPTSLVLMRAIFFANGNVTRHVLQICNRVMAIDFVYYTIPSLHSAEAWLWSDYLTFLIFPNLQWGNVHRLM